jgi:DNA-binding transcriptional ArsR family regulator
MLGLVMHRGRQAGELAELTGVTQPAARGHLRVLRDAGPA